MIAIVAINAIRFRTGRDNSGHVQDASLYPELEIETKNLRNYLAEKVPGAFEFSTTSPTVNADGEIVVPNDYRKMIRLERLLSGSGLTAHYVDVPPANPLRPQDNSQLCWRETNFQFRLALSPPQDVSTVLGWRLTYVSVPSITIDTSNDLVDVPDGFEEIVIYRVAATVAIRCHDEEKASYFREVVDGNPAKGTKGLLAELVQALRRRHGAHSRPGATPTRGYIRSSGGLP